MSEKNLVRDSLLRKKLAALPNTPGVYLMKGKGRETLYIGKARALRKRVTSYFQGRLHAPKIAVLVNKICDVEVVETQSEADALLLEAELIRQYKPRYNTELRDDKSYPLLKITGDSFPRLHVTRQRKDKRATYYGPYTDAGLLREVVRIVNDLFPIRKCERLPKTACLYYHIGQCIAPCIKPEVKKTYDQHIKEIKNFLGGGKKSLIEYLTDRMHAARQRYQFEDAQFFKEQIEALSWMRKKRYHAQKQIVGVGLAGTAELKRTLRLVKLPERIVCFDVSNIQGDQAVASKVSFFRELENKLEYRRYKIKTVKGIHDYAMIQEALRRMLKELKEGKESIAPDLMMIDGGKGHLNAAKEVLEQEGFLDLPVISIAKQFEFIFTPHQKDPVVLAPSAPGLRLLKRVRDEAHRFAITYHRHLKRKELSRSFLDDVKGIGRMRKKALLSHFASLAELKQTPVEIIAEIKGMNLDAARQVKLQIEKITFN
ncbi:MAG: hypothetical protein COV74_10125 [Candidatus Omnitrophica bacterium CG11_big_fil_rev_8_21_14_0_20_45_26]|uniref:Excinuclease ABC subunit C n=1 Tax=Candidatus Abzuiibacterium crystallinum TaxID=1974748 RepID=A0A2H0LL59_9BACT|nr:MAG: hypothetical protein COV74_10125 [Candidatus Omnitrophica bacterium CG11_big_fil_rev_8_21_14_0_20_45_26]PIW63795.1 MAG: hypothetical protein COW12_09010 [Candidatus Omnitrophica bacterium CG12_big_fil_rev_8_21_14_0_65_45_16]